MSKKKSGEEKKMKAVKLNDGSKTIIYIDENADPEKEIAKYLKDLQEYPKASMMNFTKGRAKSIRG